jgi:hypothetical protein
MKMREINVPKYQPSQYKTKAAAVLDMLKGGETVKQIKNRMKVSDSYIYAMKKLMQSGVEALGTPCTNECGPKPGEYIMVDGAKSIDEIDAILNERASTYGSFEAVAETAQSIKDVLNTTTDLPLMRPDQREALDMIFSKIARIVNGNPDYVDSWIDIAGYATLVADRLQGKVR